MKKNNLLTIILLIFFIISPSTYATVTATVDVVKLQKRILSNTMDLYGILETNPEQALVINLPISGQIQQVNVTEGQIVKKGDTLFLFKPDPSAILNYQQAVSSLHFAESELSRMQHLFKQQLATRSQVASADKALKDAQANFYIAETLGGDVPIKSITAPFNGMISQIAIHPGDRVQNATALMQLGTCQQLIALVGADPVDAANLHEEMQAKIQIFSASTKKTNGNIIHISHQVNPLTHLVDVWINTPQLTCDNSFLGASLKSTVMISSQQYWSVPQSAVLSDEKGSYIYRVQNQHAILMRVKVLVEEEGWAGIEGPDLKEGDLIVSQGNYELENNMNVRVLSL